MIAPEFMKEAFKEAHRIANGMMASVPEDTIIESVVFALIDLVDFHLGYLNESANTMDNKLGAILSGALEQVLAARTGSATKH